MPRSMTGFARLERQENWGTIACEIRTVNHRYLEPTLRLPDSLKGVESEFRARLKKQLSRGKVEAIVHLKLESAENKDLALNEALADQIQALAIKVADKLPDAGAIDPLEILRWPGVIQAAEVDRDILEQAALTHFDATLEKLVENREREGTELKHCILQRLDDIGRIVANVREHLPEILAAHKAKLREKLEALQVEIDQERFAQEAVYIAQKVDVAEEIDRLDAHVAEVTLALDNAQPVGRRLDFLMQELNREANTLSSKSIAADTTQSAVDLKVLIEQIREQVQNIE